ncbi:hypothetical protein BCR59_27080 [Klebsiella pneumoniae]|nr:hypothetical protein BCR59_27080 [Klebsiella pneumoniae]
MARVTLLPALLVIVAVAVGCALVSPPVGTRHEILTNPGLYIDLLALLFLVFMLWSSAKVRMSHIAVNWVRYGLRSCLRCWLSSLLLSAAPWCRLRSVHDTRS